jgi:hypothetical protein
VIRVAGEDSGLPITLLIANYGIEVQGLSIDQFYYFWTSDDFP